VTQTYHRSLLEDIDADAIRLFLDETVDVLSSSTAIDERFKRALVCRLKFRKAFLTSIDVADTRTADGATQFWDEMLGYLPQLRTTAELAKPVPASFSTKLQRKLASTVPPRPMVQIPPEAAYDHLERLCQHGSTVVQVLKYNNPHSLMVGGRSTVAPLTLMLP
jgi:N-alpha-acetyltransferase 35, NatC auxiliary subunit